MTCARSLAVTLLPASGPTCAATDGSAPRLTECAELPQCTLRVGWLRAAASQSLVGLSEETQAANDPLDQSQL